MRQCRALELRWEERPVSVRFSVDDDRAAWRDGQSGAESFVLQRFRGDDRECRSIFVERARYFTDGCRKQNFVSEPSQCLRETFEQGDVSADENHFCHYGVPSLSQVLNRLQVDPAHFDHFVSRGES